MKARSVKKYTRKAIQVTRKEGVLGLTIAGLTKIKQRKQKTTKDPRQKIQFTSLVAREDVKKANWSTHPYIPPAGGSKGPYTINWVMSPPGPSGGGHQNIFRFISYLEKQGYTNRVYLYSTFDFPSIETVRQNLSGSYAKTSASIEWLKGPMAPADAIFATGWETAYSVFNDPSSARRFYFVQDFEPYFYPVGSDYILAENTYRFGFYGITAGGWLAKKLHNDYGMQCSNYDFGADTELYRYTNDQKRKEIFFYARPVTTRRGFELGILALEIFHEKRPDYTITLAGWDVSDYDIPFPYNNLKALSLSELSDVYNRSGAALVMSLTNMSLLPLELLAAGTIPVVNNGENNRLVSNNPYIKYADASPDALAQALIDTVDREDLPAYAKEASKSVGGLSWDKSGAVMESILREQLRG
jgi:glycosyltransferase involved in cell wall biosynthesis